MRIFIPVCAECGSTAISPSEGNTMRILTPVCAECGSTAVSLRLYAQANVGFDVHPTTGEVTELEGEDEFICSGYVNPCPEEGVDLVIATCPFGHTWHSESEE